MAHGTPDWGGSAPKIRTYRLADHAELAVRLGSPVNYDRGGEVLFCDDFEGGGDHIIASGTGVGNNVALSCDKPLQGSLCLAMTTGDLPLDVSKIRRVHYYPVEKGVGQQIGFAPVPNLYQVTMVMTFFTGAIAHTFEVRYDHVLGTLSVRDSTLAWITIGVPGVVLDTDGIYSTMKLVVDLLSDTYVRALFNGVNYSAAGLYSVAPPDLTPRSMDMFVYVNNVAAGAITVQADVWILTQNEPVM